MARNEHLIVIMLEAVPHNVEFEVWPPHITIVPWFPCDDFEKLNRLLEDIASRHEAFIVKAGKRETWGNKEPFEVARIDDPGELHRLHWEIFQRLESNGFPIHQKDFMGEKYTPHVALRNHLQKDWDHQLGEEVIVDRFALVQQMRLKKTGRMIKTVRKEYWLK